MRHWWLAGMTDQYIATWQTGDKAGVQTGDKAGGQTGDKAGGQTGDEAGGQTGDEAGGQAWDEAGDEAGVGQRMRRGPSRGARAGGRRIQRGVRYNEGSEAPRRLGPPHVNA